MLPLKVEISDNFIQNPKVEEKYFAIEQDFNPCMTFAIQLQEIISMNSKSLN